ncbi:MAG TPA: nitroreductase family deazaflavin-dependent oxidoreductase [Anaerolineae bacterium]
MVDQNAFNRKLIEDFRASRETDPVVLNGRPLLLLTTLGARSGQPHTTPVMTFPDGDRYIVIASNAGAPKHPDWYRNLVAHPEVTVEVGKETFDGIATVAAGEERERLWKKATEVGPFFTDHQAKITRQIPVVILSRR